MSTQLTERLGKGFDVTNLRNMRRFYHAFPIWETVSLELSWSHYNALSRIDNEPARHYQQYPAVLLELGKGFAFVERQQRIRFADEDFYIDLVFETTSSSLP